MSKYGHVGTYIGILLPTAILTHNLAISGNEWACKGDWNAYD